MRKALFMSPGRLLQVKAVSYTLPCRSRDVSCNNVLFIVYTNLYRGISPDDINNNQMDRRRLALL